MSDVVAVAMQDQRLGVAIDLRLDLEEAAVLDRVQAGQRSVRAVIV